MDSGLAARSQVYAGCVNLPAMRRPGLTVELISGSVSQPFGQEAQQARRDEAGMAAGLLDRIAKPVVRRAVHDARTRLEFRLLERLQEFERLRLVIHHVVLGAPDQEHGGLV